jgi:hypothetical protein
MPYVATLSHHDDGNETLRQDGAKRVEQSHIEGIALQGSFLLPFKSNFAWSHAEDQRDEELSRRSSSL